MLAENAMSYTVNATEIQRVTAGHIHTGDLGENGVVYYVCENGVVYYVCATGGLGYSNVYNLYKNDFVRRCLKILKSGASDSVDA
jgi:hypothetical protein